jgi:hypothetical protein
MDVADVARAVLHMANLPLEVNIPFLTIMARDMPYLGRGLAQISPPEASPAGPARRVCPSATNQDMAGLQNMS